MGATPETLFAEIAAKTQEMLTAEIYARVSHIPMLSHYTNVEAFGSILRGRELWFSSVRDMNDTSEAIEGFQLACKALEHHGPLIFENYAHLMSINSSELGSRYLKPIHMSYRSVSMGVTDKLTVFRCGRPMARTGMASALCLARPLYWARGLEIAISQSIGVP
jgi:hypothetical protein